MANFDVQIQALAGSATQSEMDEWMGEGIKEIINVLPAKLKSKCSSMTVSTNASAIDLDGVAEILFVTRENADSGYHTPCREIEPQFGHLAEDSTDLVHYGTATDPVYWIGGASSGSEEGEAKLTIFPDPTAGQPANVHHISYATVNASDVSVIANFPNEAEYLVVLYAAIKVLHNKMLGLASPNVPVAPTDPNFTFLNLGIPPTYTSPTVGGASESLTSSITALTSTQLGTDADFLDVSKWFAALGEMIEDDEDIELAGAQIEKINSYIQSYNIEMQNQLNIFNDAATEYQAKLQEATQTAQLSSTEYSSKLTKFQLEVSKYTAEVNENAQKLQNFQGRYTQLKADYFTGLQMLISGGLPQVQQQEQRRGRR